MDKAHFKPLRAAALAATLVMVTGCATAGKFNCPAPDGVACMSTSQIYDLTNGEGSLVSAAGPAPSGKAARAAAKKDASHLVSATGDSLSLSAPVQANTGALREAALSLGGGGYTTAEVVPSVDAVARVPAMVMRIWVAPWTDVAGDLHMPSYVYTEIAGRRWSVGGDVRNANATSFDPNGPWTPSTTSVTTN